MYKVILSLIIGVALSACSKKKTETPLPILKALPDTGTFNGRALKYMGCVDVSDKTVNFELWDITVPADDDGYTLYLNGNEIGKGRAQTAQNKLVTSLELDYQGYNRLVYEASTNGFTSFNSVNVRINGKRVQIQSDYDNSGYIYLVYDTQDVACKPNTKPLSTVMFWSDEQYSPCGVVAVTLSCDALGYEEKLNIEGYYTNTQPDCGGNLCATFENLAAGTYTFVTGCNKEKTGTIEVSGEPICYKRIVWDL